MDKKDDLDRWAGYMEDIFEAESGTKHVIKKELDRPPILKKEVEDAIKKTKFGQATGPDNIPIQKLTTIEDLVIGMTTKLLNVIYESGEILYDLIQSVFMILPKSPGDTECECTE